MINTLKNSTLFLLVFSLTACVSKNPWESAHKTPTNKPAQIYGGYSAGCLDGAVKLPFTGKGFQFVRTERGRFYGHPRLREFIKSFATKISKYNFGKILIADMAQPRGGPMPSGHASHQVGLDADIYFRRLETTHPPLTANEGNNFDAISTLNEDQSDVGEFWNKDHVAVLKLASSYPEVERIFVHFQIKKKLCQTNKGEEWLSKIRPWWGHHYHFHVRLSCPSDSPHCKPQAIPAPTDGCDQSLSWWLSEEASKEGSQKRAKSDPKLPEQCNFVFSNPGTNR